MKLSIILPIYNVEPYLEKCIRSLEDQDIPKDSYEIICVNDGSPDNSQQIVEKLQQEFSNIILINQENKGVSVARNVGIEKASGNYILFVDPDDTLKENCLASLLNYASADQYEVVFSPFTFVEMTGEKKEQKYSKGLENLMDGPTLYHAVRGNAIIDPDRSVAILYSRELLIKNKLKFLKNIPYLEDGEFIARVLCLTKRGSIYNHPYYLRLNRPGSATRSDLFSERRSIQGFLLASKNLLNFQEKTDIDQRQQIFLNQPICKFVILAVQACAVKFSIKNFNWVKKVLKNNSMVKLELVGCNLLYTKLGKNYNRSVNYFFIILMLQHIKKFIKIKFQTF